MGLAVSEQSLPACGTSRRETSRKRQGIYRDLNSGVVKLLLEYIWQPKTREVDEVSLRNQREKKEFLKGIANGVGGCGSRQARSLRIQSTELVTGGLSKRPTAHTVDRQMGGRWRSRNRTYRPCVLEICNLQKSKDRYLSQDSYLGLWRLAII